MVEAVNHLKVRSCLIDGEVVCCDESGVAAFQLLRHRRKEPKAFLYAFDLLELNGTDLRPEPIEIRKTTLASTLRKARNGLPARLQDGAGRDCLEAAGIALPIGLIARLAEVQELQGTCSQVRIGGGLGR